MKKLFAVATEEVMTSSKLRFCIMLVGVFLMFAAVSTAQAAPAASGSGSTSINGELDALVGGSMWGGDFGYCDNIDPLYESCTNKGNNTWKINVEGAILFPVGSGRFSFGPVFGVAYRGGVSQTYTYTGDGTSTDIYNDRINSLFVGGRVSAKLGEHVRVFVEAGPSVNTDRQSDTYSGNSTGKYYYNTTTTAPEEAIGLTYFASKHVGLTVKYERQDIRNYQSRNSNGNPYDTVVHENGILGGLTFWFGDR